MDTNSLSVSFNTFMTFFIHSLRMLLARGEDEQMQIYYCLLLALNTILLLVLAIRKKNKRSFAF